MPFDVSVNRHYELGVEAGGAAPDLAAAAALLEIGDRLGVVDLIGSGRRFDAAGVAAATELPKEGVANYLEALEVAGIIEADGNGSFRAIPDFDRIRHQAGYLSWTMNANRPFIEHAHEFLTDPARAKKTFTRDGLQVAVSSQWMGSKAFYPAMYELVVDMNPSRVVDLGAGSARLLIDVLRACPTSTAVGLDLDAGACREAARAATDAGVADRLTIVERSIQSVATDPSPLAGAQVIHAGFVFHDMMPEEEQTADTVLANCRDALRPGGMMAITEAVPYLRDPRERRFSSIVSYYHKQFMGRRLLGEHEWLAKLRSAGFSDVTAIKLAFPTGRLFVATR